MKIDVAKLEGKIFDLLEKSRTNGDLVRTTEGVVYHIDGDVSAKVFSGDPTSSMEAATHTYKMSKYCYEKGAQIPEPYGLIQLFEPEGDLKEDLFPLTMWVYLMETIKGGKTIPDFSLHEFPRRKVLKGGRRHSDIAPRQTKKAKRQYYEQLLFLQDIGVVVGDSAFFANTIYCPPRKKIYLLDPSHWDFGDERELKEFREKIERRARVF